MPPSRDRHQCAAPADSRDLAGLVLDHLAKATAPVPRTELRDRICVNNNRLGVVLDELLRAGRIRRMGDGWTLSSFQS